MATASSGLLSISAIRALAVRTATASTSCSWFRPALSLFAASFSSSASAAFHCRRKREELVVVRGVHDVVVGRLRHCEIGEVGGDALAVDLGRVFVAADPLHD